MRILLYGATGMVGSRIAAEAVSRGHELTAASRSGTEVDGAESSPAADFMDFATYSELVVDHDVVVLAVPPDRSGGSHEPFLAAHRHIARSMSPARVVVVGGAGASLVDGVRLLDAPGFPDQLKPEASAMAAVYDAYAAAEFLDWTMPVPAPVIEPGARTGTYRLDGDSPAGEHVSAEDFAVAVLDEIEEHDHTNRRFTVADA
jgi:putative NADH-flavin reductase